jgi:hypothetical protein
MPLVTITTDPAQVNLNPDGETTFRTQAFPTPGVLIWGFTTTANSNPGEVFASPEIVAEYNAAWATMSVMVVQTDVVGMSVGIDSERFWSNAHWDPTTEYPLGGMSETHVPRLGRWLEGYTVSDVSLLATYNPPPFVGAATIRLRFYGEPVPEATTLALMLCAAILHSSFVFRHSVRPRSL